MNDKISIIVPYYDSSPFLLRKCLSSCFKQSYDNIQVILLNDGSPHDISAIVDEYRRDHNNFVYVKSRKNHGVSYQRNKGIELAEGKYLLFVDSDDYIDQEMAGIMHDKITHDDSDMCICGIDGAIYNCYDGLYDAKVVLSMPEMFNYVQYTNFAANKMFKSEIVNDYNIRFKEDIKLGEDAVFCQEYYKHVAYVSFADKKLYHYIIKDTSSTSKYYPDFFKYEERVISGVYNNFSTYALCARQHDFLEKWVLDKYAVVVEYYLANNAPISKVISVVSTVRNSGILHSCYKNIGHNICINKCAAKRYRSVFNLSRPILYAKKVRNHAKAVLT